ncbi:VWA domain-containing protein [Phycisphaerales bacterium AB-hyl4]|uniref:VWA domain-containing protein n=1 Tax=Natronomicrosphaera hydrolytica TaxID=3242702 RepID=A0ABV4U2Z5_9BACT
MLNFRFDQPELLWLLLLAVPIVWLGRRSLASLDPTRRWTAVGLRLAVLAVLVFMLAGLQLERRHSDLTVMAVVDQSESVRRFAQPPTPAQRPGPTAEQHHTIEQWQQQWLYQATRGRRQDDRFGMITYDGRPTVRSLPSPVVNITPGTIDQPVEGTDAAAGLRTALALFPGDTGQRMLWVSDGNDGTIDATGRVDGSAVLDAAREAAAAGIAIDVVPLSYRLDREVMVEGIYAPTEVREGQTVALRVVLRSTHRARGTLHLLHDDEPVNLNPEGNRMGVPITPDDWTAEGDDGDAVDDTGTSNGASQPGRYVAVTNVEIPLHYAGVSRFEAVFDPASGHDQITANNRAEAFTLVAGEGRVLFVDNVGGDSGTVLPRALQSRGILLDIVTPRSLPTRLTQLQRYDGIVLQNVPADLFTTPQHRMLAEYVHDLGGGLVMVGGPESFGAGGWANTHVDRVLPVESQIPSQRVMPSGALVLVIDRSGSMSANVAGTRYNRQEIANEAAVLALQALFPQDLIGVVVFDRQADWVVDVQPASDQQRIASRIRSIQPRGGTHIYPGLVEATNALRQLSPQDAAVRHIVLLTDGMDNPGLQSDYPGVVRDMLDNDISLTTVGIGEASEIDGALLEDLANRGGGEFYHVTNPADLPQIFIKEARTIRQNLVKEQTFTPQLQNTGSPIMANVTGVPELHGLVLTGEKDDPRVVTPILGPDGEPVFAHWQVGLGRAAAFTSDATNRWATPWLQWDGYADFWARTMRYIARPSVTQEADLVTSIRGQSLNVRLDLGSDILTLNNGDADGEQPRVFGTILRPDGTTETIDLQQTGPGIFEATAAADVTGSYIVSLTAPGPDGERRSVYGGANRPPGGELRRFESNTALLQQVAELTGGRVFDPADAEAANLFERTFEFESRSIRPLWRVLLVWLIVLFLLDVACRRIAWDLPAIWGWTRTRADAMLGLFQARDDQQTEATLATLKHRRAAATQGRAASSEGDAASAAPPAPARKRKFEADPNAKPAADLHESVGGATDQPTPGASQMAREQADREQADADAHDTTNRLLAAKRRARQNADRNR